MDNKPSVVLVNIQEYAKKWGLNRNTVSRLIKNSLITVYQDLKGRRLLNPNEIPPKEVLVRSMK